MSSVDPSLTQPAQNAAAPSPSNTIAGSESELQALLARYEKETKALGNSPAAAPLFHEMGQLWEALKSPRNASLCYENALRLDPRNVPNLRAARRLFAEVGNWQLVLTLLDAELGAVTDGAARAELWFERGQLLEERLGRAPEAVESYEKGLSDHPNDVALLTTLEQAYAARHEDAKLLAVTLQLAELCTDERLKAYHFFNASNLCADRLGQEQQAADLLDRAFALRRHDPVLLAAVKRRAEKSTGEALLKALAAEAEVMGPQAGPAYYRISRIYERLNRSEDAVGALQAARRVAPQDALVLSELARLYETFGRWEELAEVLNARVGFIADEAERVALFMRLGALLDERLHREDEAIGCYQQVLQLQPSNQLALTALGKLYFRRKDWAGLLSTHEREAASMEDPRLKAAPLYKAAEILEQRLNRDEEAISRYNELLQLVPGYLPAQKALTRLYEKHSRYAELAAMYEAEVAATRDRDQAISTLHQVSAIYEEHLKDVDRAAGALRRVLELAPEHLPTIRALARLYERSGRWAEVVEMNDLESQNTGDTKQIVSLLHRNAEIYEEKLGQGDRAIDAYSKLLALSPAYLPALKALGRLYAQRQRWADLIQMYRQEADIAPSIEQAATLTFKIGEIHEEKLKDVDSAVAAYQEVLTLAPTHFQALRALARIHRAGANWESLVEVLRAEAAARTDPGERANTLFQVAAIWEDAGRLELAVEAYQEVLRLSPAHVTSLRALERIFSEQNNTSDLVALYERETQSAPNIEDRVAAYAKLARLYQFKLEEPQRAAACYEQLLALQPGHLEALKGLELIRNADRVRRLEIRRQLAEQLQSPAIAAALWASAAADLERQGKPEEALMVWRRAHGAYPALPRAAVGLENALNRAGDARGLAQLLATELDHEQNPAARTSLAMRAARLAEGAGEQQTALSMYVAAASQSPGFLPALRGMRRMRVALGDFAGAREALHAEAASSADKGEAVTAWYESGLLALERLNDAAGATADFQKALELDPLAPAPAQKLEELLARQGGGAALAQMLLRRGEARFATGQRDEAAQAFLDAARILRDDLHDPAGALGAAERAVAAVPTHPLALTLQGDLLAASGHPLEAARAYAARIEQGGDRLEMAQIHLRLAMLYQDHLNEEDRAAAHLQTALADEPNNLEALERLSHLHLGNRNWTAAGEVLHRLCSLESDPPRLAVHLLALARVLDEGFNDAAGAIEAYRRVLEITPENNAVFDRLAYLYERQGKAAELAQLLEAQAQRASGAHAVQLRMRAGGVYARLGESPRASAQFRFAIEAEPANPEPRAALAELLAREGTGLTAAIEEYRNLLRIDPFRADAYHALFKLYDQTKQVDRQLCVASLLVFLKQANELESLFVNDAKVRLPQDTAEKVNEADYETLLLHPLHRGGLGELLRLIGDQLYKLYPADLDALGIGRSDRLKPDHALGKPLRSICASLGVERFEVYQGKRGAVVTVENTDPQSVVIGPDVVRKYQTTRDQRFLFARAALTLRSASLLALRLSGADLANVLGGAMRAVQPNWTGLGNNDAELAKKIRKALPGKVLKEIEVLAPELSRAKMDAAPLAQGAVLSADRAGMLYSGDVAGSLLLMIREDPQQANARLDSFDAVKAAVGSRQDVRELMLYAISDDFFRMRQKLRLGLS